MEDGEPSMVSLLQMIFGPLSKEERSFVIILLFPLQTTTIARVKVEVIH